MLRTQFPANLENPETFPDQTHFGSGDWSPHRDGVIPTVDDPVSEELTDSVLEYGFDKND